MICPYCKKEINISTGFCPECGQDVFSSKYQNQSDSYWKNVNQEDLQRAKEYSDMVFKTKQEASSQRTKRISTIIVVLIVAIAAILGIVKFQQYQNEMIAEVKAALVGKTMTDHSTHMEGLGWIHHEYRQLTFKDETTLDYAYIQTVGPAEDDENPHYKGTYSYTVSRSITGKYTIRVNGQTYELNVDDSNVPISISR